MNDLSSKTTIVVGASRGLGRGVTTAFGAALVELVQADAATVAPGYLLTSAGLQKLPEEIG